MNTSHKGLTIGQSASLEKVFSAADVAEYTELTGDANFEEGTVPGPLLGGMISNLLGTKLPGRGTNWLKQRYAFPAQAHVGEIITAKVEITRIRPEKELVNLRVTCTTPSGEVVCRGESLVLVADLETVEA
jgi:3-hydroxybutyryl-CoA dehydratase